MKRPYHKLEHEPFFHLYFSTLIHSGKPGDFQYDMAPPIFQNHHSGLSNRIILPLLIAILDLFITLKHLDQKARKLLLPGAHCRRKAGSRAEITLNGFQLSVLDSEILHVPERFTVLGVAKILHKSIIRVSGDPLQVKMSNEINLCFPAARLESALADVVVVIRTRKSKVVRQQGVERVPVLLLPPPVPLPDDLLVR